MSAPLVTAIVSTYRAERFFEGCLEDLLGQTLGERLEIVVVDSASPERESEIARSYQPRHPNLHVLRTARRENTSRAFNRAIKIASGRYLTTANTDDRHHPAALEILARALDEHPEAGIVYADSLITEGENETFARHGARWRYAWPDFTLPTALSCCLFGSQPMWRREVHEAVGLFDPAIRIANDQDMFLRIAWRFGAIHVREDLGLFLRRPDSESGVAHRDPALAEVMAVLRRYRAEIPLEDLFSGLDAKDPAGWCAALVEMANLCALGPYNDYGAALNHLRRAAAAAGEERSLREAVANNLGCVLACAGRRREARRAFEVARGFENARANLVVLEAQEERAPRPAEMRFASIDHPVVRESRKTRGLLVAPEGGLVWSAPHEQLPWDVFEGPSGVPLEGPAQSASPVLRPAARPVARRDVLVVMYGWADGGGGTILPRQVARGLARRGRAVSVFTAAARPCPELGPYELHATREDGVDLRLLCNRPTDFLDLTEPEREIHDGRALAAFERVLDETRPRVVHFYNLHNLSMALPGACRRRGIPTVASPNNYWPMCPRLYLVRPDLSRCAGPKPGRCAACAGGGAVEAEAYGRRARAGRDLLRTGFDLVLAPSARMAELHVAHGAPPERTRILLQQPATLDEVWARVGVRRVVAAGGRGGPLRVGYFGSLLAHKGAHVLVHALQLLPPGRVRAVLHGGGDPGYAAWLRRLDRAGLVEFGGLYEADELPGRLAGVDVVVVPSVWEDCAPFVVAEALAARAPVVGSAIGGIPDFFEEGRTGFTFPAGDARALAARLRRFLEDPGLLGRMQRAIPAPRGFQAYLDDLEAAYAEVRRLPAGRERPAPAGASIGR